MGNRSGSRPRISGFLGHHRSWRKFHDVGFSDESAQSHVRLVQSTGSLGSSTYSAKCTSLTWGHTCRVKEVLTPGAGPASLPGQRGRRAGWGSQPVRRELCTEVHQRRSGSGRKDQTVPPCGLRALVWGCLRAAWPQVQAAGVLRVLWPVVVS